MAAIISEISESRSEFKQALNEIIAKTHFLCNFLATSVNKQPGWLSHASIKPTGIHKAKRKEASLMAERRLGFERHLLVTRLALNPSRDCFQL